MNQGEHPCATVAPLYPRDTSLEEEGGADVDGVERDGAKREEGAAESDCRDRS